MVRAKAILTGMAAAVAFGAAAHAADPPRSWDPGPFSYERPAPRFVELSSGWYARGDFAYRFNQIGSVDLTSTNTISSMSYLDTAVFGIGGGYKYQWFRADFTVDYGLTSRIKADSTSAVTQPQYSAQVDTVSMLGNVYLDLGTWAGFTPYIGGGAGMSYLRAKDFIDTTLTVAKVSSATTNLSWAAMTGIAYQINHSWVVDVGYRYIRLGDLPSSAGSGLPTDSTTWKQISAQEFRIGLRVLLH